MNLSYISAKRVLKRLIDTAGTISIHSLLWHNTTFDPIDYPMWGKLYWHIIDYALKKQGWVTSSERYL